MWRHINRPHPVVLEQWQPMQVGQTRLTSTGELKEYHDIMPPTKWWNSNVNCCFERKGMIVRLLWADFTFLDHRESIKRLEQTKNGRKTRYIETGKIALDETANTSCRERIYTTINLVRQERATCLLKMIKSTKIISVRSTSIGRVSLRKDYHFCTANWDQVSL